MPPRRSRSVRGIVPVLLLALSLSGCQLLGGDDGPTYRLDPVALPSTPAGDADPALASYYEQDVTWETCREDFECATIEAPLDYGDPDGESISLALLKVPAADPDARIGSLVVNPGGPGGSGISYAAQAENIFGAELRRAYDIVGFDPRGVGESTPVDCVDDETLDELLAADPDPDTPAEVAASQQASRELSTGCFENSGDVAGHVSTVEAARDIDLIRGAVGDERLSWFGASYGTILGATYAELFPERVGRMVLDGAVDPTLPGREKSLVQAEGFETALRAYVGACVDGDSCFLGDDVDEGVARIQDFLAEVDQQALPAGSRELEIGNAVLGIWTPLYNQDYWTYLNLALRQAFDGDGSTLLALSDAYVRRGPDGYTDNGMEALQAINCLDDPTSIPPAEVPPTFPEFEEASPTFGRIFAWGQTSCRDWPARAAEKAPRLTAEGAAPILVVGTSRDPATPLVWAEALAEQLESGVLVRRDGDGHTAYQSGNACIDDTLEEYLVEGTVPPGTTDC